jgi:hypothetical protein
LARAEGISGRSAAGRTSGLATRYARPFYLLELDGEDFRPIPLARRLQREAPTPDNMPAATGSPQ